VSHEQSAPTGYESRIDIPEGQKDWSVPVHTGFQQPKWGKYHFPIIKVGSMRYSRVANRS
jgi:hypothetical protein